MPRPSFILFPAPTRWRIAACDDGNISTHDVPISPDTSLADIASTLSTRLAQLKYTGDPILLALLSDHCLSATLDTSSLDRPDRKTLLFQLEEKLPLPAESLVADFIPSGNTTLGVCARTDTLSPLIDALESAGLPVHSVTPAALLAAQQSLSHDPSDRLLLLADTDHLDLLTLRDRTITHSHSSPATPDDLRLSLRLALLNLSPSTPVHTVGLTPDLLHLAQSLHPHVESNNDQPISLAARTGAEILNGTRKPLIDLRRDALAPSDPLRLHRPALNALLAAAAIFLLALTLAFLLRSQRHARAADNADRESRDAFASALPGWPAPTNVLDVLESEVRKRSEASPRPASETAAYSGLDMLHDVLSRFPRDVRCTLEQLTFSATLVEMSGRIHSYADADRIASAARDAGLQVPPPQVRREPDSRWRFSLQGTRQPASREAMTSTQGGAP